MTEIPASSFPPSLAAALFRQPIFGRRLHNVPNEVSPGPSSPGFASGSLRGAPMGDTGPRDPLRGGFTLIEVTLAVTIAALALVGLLGMVPQGIRTMRLATDLAIEARIHQQIVSELTQTDWEEREEYDDQVRFYDDQGIQVTERQNRQDPDRFPIIYAARILVPRESSPLPEKFVKPGESRTKFDPFDHTDVMEVYSNNNNNEFDGVQLVLIEISSSPNVRDSDDFDKPINEASINVYRSTLTRTTKRNPN